MPMEGENKSTNWQDWTLLGLRFLLLIVLGLILFTSKTPTGQPRYVANEAVLALIVGVVATVLLAIPTLIPGFNKVLPFIVCLGDWAIVAIVSYVTRGDQLLVAASGGLLVVSSALRLGFLWGTVEAIGVLIASFAVVVFIYGTDKIPEALAADGLPLLMIGLFAVFANAWGGTLRRHLESQESQLVEVQIAKALQSKNMQERTRSIYDMAATLSSTLNYEKILHAAMNAGWLGLKDMTQKTQSNDKNPNRLTSMVMLFRASDNQLHVVVSRGLARTDENRVLPANEGVMHEALTQCIPIIGQNARKDPELGDFVAFQSMRSTLCIPLRAGYDNYGVMVYGSEQTDAFTDEHTELLTAIGTQATVALQNAVLYENLQSERDRIVEVEEEARKKLARDLHDGPTQSISAIAMRANIIQRMLEKTPKEVPAELKKVEELARNTTKEIRHMLFTLRPLVLENQGIAAALGQLSEKMKETHNQNVAVRVSKDAEKLLDTHQQGTIFYIVEEAVGNARKHAEASLISVTVMKQEDVVLVSISDNGKGFDTTAVETNYDKRGSLGMVNLKERTELLGGTLRIESQIGRGTSITVIVPIKDDQMNPPDRRSRKAAATGSTSKLAAHAVDKIRAAQQEQNGRQY